MLEFSVSQSIDLNSDVILYPGDCMDLLSALPPGMAKLVITSPPYNIGKPYEKRLHLSDYLDQQEKVIRAGAKLVANDGSICWQVGKIPVKVILIDSN